MFVNAIYNAVPLSPYEGYRQNQDILGMFRGRGANFGDMELDAKGIR
jgi:hypothetical protein